MTNSKTRKPGRPSHSESQKQEIRTNIVNIARDLFVEEGYENTSMRKIAAKANFAPTKIYYYFENKQEILRCFWDDIAAELWDYIQVPESTSQNDPLKVLRHIMLKSVKYWIENSKSYQLSVATQHCQKNTNVDNESYCSPNCQKYNDLIKANVQKCIDIGVFVSSDQALISQTIELTIYGIYATYYRINDIVWDEKESLIQFAIDNTLRGLKYK